MTTKTRLMSGLMAAAVICGASLFQPALGAEVLEGPDSLNIDGQLQLHSVIEGVDDPYKTDGRLFLFLRQARLSINGEHNGAKYEAEWMLGGEEVPERNSVMSLLDFYVDLPVTEALRVKLGQFKVPYSRERLMDSGDAFNVNRSVGNNFFNIGRDVGGAAYMEEGNFTAALGVFTGGGINIPERYIPEDVGVPMFVLRAGINDGLDEDILTPVNASTALGKEGFAAFVNGMYNEDSRVGHSTPLNVKYYDKSLMLNSDYNPYVTARGVKSTYAQAGVDVAFMTSLSEESSLLVTAEANFSSFDNSKGTVETVGGVVSANVVSENWVFGLRYSMVDPDDEMGYTDDDGNFYQLTDKVIHEITPSVVYFLPDTGIKVIAELSYQMDVPVSIEKNNGVYNLMRQSDQISYAANEGIELQDNYLASLVIQYNF